MRQVMLGVSSLDEAERRLSAAFSGETQGVFLSFETPELLWKILTVKRWEILRALTGVGVLSIREAARRVGRDVKAVHGDIQALISAGLIERRAGGIEFPYDEVKVSFTVGKAA